jgi:hypothetical protein
MGFNPLLAPRTVSHVWTHDPAADEVFSLFRFPAAGYVTNAYATNSATVVTEAGTSLAIYLVKYSSAATPVVQGTLGSWTATAAWGVDIPRTMTKTAFGSTALFATGEWVRVSYDETATGTWTEMGFQVDHVFGYSTQTQVPSAGTGPA